MGTKRHELTPGEIEKQALSCMSAENISADYIRMVSELFAVEYYAERKFRLKDIYSLLTKAETLRRLKAELPAVEAERIVVGEAALLGLLEKTLPILMKYAPEGGLTASKLRDAAKNGETSLLDLIRGVVAGDNEYIESLAQQLGLAPAQLIFIGTELARPVMRRLYRAVAAKIRLDETTGDICPVCGASPLMARFQNDDGKRLIECSLCGAIWAVPRLRCLECGNEDDSILGFIYVDGKDTRRIDKCDKCHAYIKTVDERKMAGNSVLSLRIEDAATLYLDILAEKKGYHSLR